MGVYDISEAFERIEDELIGSMMRNFSRHRIEEIQQGFEWEQWQVLQLQALEKYRRDNQKKFPARFNKLNGQIADALNTSYQDGAASQERQILKAVQKGYSPPVKLFSGQAEVTGEFFKVNDKRLDALITATTSDMSKAEYSILRQADDQYRKIIFNAQVYANTGAGTYEKAVDMATKDFLKAGINSIEYKDGSRHSIEEYSRMALQTGIKRAYLQGEGEKRKEFGIPTVILKKRTCACPKCLPFVGKVFIDDVWSGGDSSGISPVTGIKYPLLSQAIKAGLYHPNCRDTHSTYIEGISTPPEDSTYTVEELDEIAERYKAEQKRNYCENQAERYNRLSKYSLDSGNKRIYGARAKVWEDKAGQYKNFLKMSSGSESINISITSENADKPITTAEMDSLKSRLENIGVRNFDGKKLTTAVVIDEFIKQLEYLHKEYNKMFFNISVVDLLKGDIAQVTPSNVLQLNAMYFNSSSAMKAVIKEFIEKKLLPKRATIKYIATHEWGHFISTDDLNNPKSPMRVLFKRTKPKDFVSYNAEKDVYEYVADAIACNINNIACKNSDKVVEYFLKGVV